MIGSISDVLTRISGIEQQIQSLRSGTLLAAQLGTTAGASGATAAATTPTTGSAGAGNFANQLATAQGASALGSSGASGASPAALLSSALGSTGAGGPSTAVAGGPYSTLSGATPAAASGSVSLSPSASSQLTPAQQQFASTLSADTGLNPNVVSAWLLAEESGGAAQSRQAAGNNDWLNIGYTDSGTYGSADSVWSDPTTAANATAQWLQGQNSIPGYGTASAGIQSILSTVGQSPQAQIQAIQSSGWSSGGYPELGSLYASLGG
jgi:hypothetical protein